MPPRPLLAILLLLLGLPGLAACGLGGDLLDASDVLPSGPSDPDPAPPGATMSPEELQLAGEVLARVNAERQARGVHALTWDEAAAEVAYRHSVDMDVRGFFSHTNPDGQLPWDRLTAAGVAWSTCGENIAYGYDTAAAVMDGWMDSAGHRANILDGGFTRLGIGVHRSGSKTWWTQLFYRP